MGSKSSTSVVSAVSAAHEALRRERELKSEEKVMLVIGSKSLLIEKLIELYKEDEDGDDIETDFIPSKYQTGPFIFNELTPKSLSLHATSNFKHLCLFNVYDATYLYNSKDNLERTFLFKGEIVSQVKMAELSGLERPKGQKMSKLGLNKK